MDTFFNFIASHDGIGLRPAEDILSRTEIQNLVDRTLAHSGQVSYKNNPDGSQSAYELNITLFDALSDPYRDKPESLRIDRFMAAQAMMLALAGMPGSYIHNLVGSSNYHAGVAQTGRARTINRQKWNRLELEADLLHPSTRAYHVFHRYTNLLRIRASQRAFHPNGEQQILTGNPAIFSLVRTSTDGQERILCLHNISTQSQQFKADVAELSAGETWRDLFSGEAVGIEGQVLLIMLEPYEVKWLAG